MVATACCIAATWRFMLAISAGSGAAAALASCAAAKIDQKSRAIAAAAVETWRPEPIRKRRSDLPSWKKISRVLNILRNIVRKPAFLVPVSTIYPLPAPRTRSHARIGGPKNRVLRRLRLDNPSGVAPSATGWPEIVKHLLPRQGRRSNRGTDRL